MTNPQVFTYIVRVTTDTQDHADRVMAERCNYEDAYYETPDGEWWSDVHPDDATTFEYSIQWSTPDLTVRDGRPPDQILTDFDAGARGESDVDMRSILAEALEDVLSTVALAATSLLTPEQAQQLVGTVQDYVVNNFGDD